MIFQKDLVDIHVSCLNSFSLGLQGKQKNHKGIEGHDLSKPKKKDKQNSLKVHDDDGTLDTVIQAKKKKDKNHSKSMLRFI